MAVLVQTWAEEILPGAAWIIPLSVAMSTFGACNGNMFSNSRLIVAAAREGHVPRMLAMVHVNSSTPIPSLLVFVSTTLTTLPLVFLC